MPKFNRADFVLTFEAQGMTVLLEGLINSYYTPLGSMAHGEGNSIKEYVPTEEVKKWMGRGLSCTPEDTKQAVALADAGYVESKPRMEALLAQPMLTLEDIKKAFGILATLLQQYVYFDPWMWEKAYDRHSPVDQHNIAIVQEYKNKIRGKFNEFFFDDGYLPQLLEKLGAQLGTPAADLYCYTEHELCALMSGVTLSGPEIVRRKEAYVVLHTGGQPAVYAGPEAKNIIAEFADMSSTSVEELQGKVANRGGVVRGRVRVIARNYYNASAMRTEMEMMEQGEILVSETTDPEMMPAFHKASAVVTDQGGMLSHAAITARELGLPCIVATGTASKVLKTGDMVEVDAEKGIVSVLERAV